MVYRTSRTEENCIQIFGQNVSEVRKPHVRRRCRLELEILLKLTLQNRVWNYDFD